MAMLETTGVENSRRRRRRRHYHPTPPPLKALAPDGLLATST